MGNTTGSGGIYQDGLCGGAGMGLGVGMEECLCAEHLHLVPAAARRLLRQLPPDIDVGDLEGPGYRGLLEGVRAMVRAAGSANPVRSPRAFLGVAIRGEMLNALRSRRAVSYGDDLAALPSAAPSPEAEASDRQAIANARAAVASLPANQRRVLHLRLVRGLSRDDAARAMRIGRMSASRLTYAGGRHLRAWQPPLVAAALPEALATAAALPSCAASP